MEKYNLPCFLIIILSVGRGLETVKKTKHFSRERLVILSRCNFLLV